MSEEGVSRDKQILSCFQTRENKGLYSEPLHTQPPPSWLFPEGPLAFPPHTPRPGKTLKNSPFLLTPPWEPQLNLAPLLSHGTPLGPMAPRSLVRLCPLA